MSPAARRNSADGFCVATPPRPIAQLELGETFPSRRRAVGHENGVGGRPGKVPPQLVEAFSFEPEAAQRAVLLAADKIHLERNDVPGQVILLKHARKDLDRGLKLLRNYLVRSQPIEPLDLGDVARAHDDR